MSSLDMAFTVAYNNTRDFAMRAFNLTEDQAITAITTTMDFAVTQVVDGKPRAPCTRQRRVTLCPGMACYDYLQHATLIECCS